MKTVKSTIVPWPDLVGVKRRRPLLQCVQRRPGAMHGMALISLAGTAARR